MIANSDIEKVRIFCRNPTYKNWVSLSKDTKKMLIDFSAKDSSKNKSYKKVIADNTPAYKHIDNLESNLVVLQQAIDDIATKQENHVLKTSTKIDNMINNIGKFQNENTHNDVVVAIKNLSSEINIKFQDYSKQLNSIRTQTVGNGLSSEDRAINLNMEKEISSANSIIKQLRTENNQLRQRGAELEARTCFSQTLSTKLKNFYGGDTTNLKNLVKYETEITNCVNPEGCKEPFRKYIDCLMDITRVKIGAVDNSKARDVKQEAAAPPPKVQAQTPPKKKEEAAKKKEEAAKKKKEDAAKKKEDTAKKEAEQENARATADADAALAKTKAATEAAAMADAAAVALAEAVADEETASKKAAEAEAIALAKAKEAEAEAEATAEAKRVGRRANASRRAAANAAATAAALAVQAELGAAKAREAEAEAEAKRVGRRANAAAEAVARAAARDMTKSDEKAEAANVKPQTDDKELEYKNMRVRVEQKADERNYKRAEAQAEAEAEELQTRRAERVRQLQATLAISVQKDLKDTTNAFNNIIRYDA